ncbi:MAG: hypothetical protein FJ295_00060 [Planctomycetes bacterium]|nr:hypothetical protein [Planctomycetota bacterium]
MHGHLPLDEFLVQIRGFLGSYYVALATMNAIAALYLWQTGKSKIWLRVGPIELSSSLACLAASGLFLLVSPIAYSVDPSLVDVISIPKPLRAGLDKAMTPVSYSIGTFFVLAVLFVGRRWFSRPEIAWTGLNLSLLLMGFSMTDQNFASVVTKPDNVPIVGLVFLLGFFTWLATRRAVLNDERAARGEPPLEALDSEKVLVWPDLVYTELICMVALTALMLLWAIGLQAPLEEPASAMKTPNPSKAPWYFLGLQEMLVYYDPWMAGVVLPVTVIGGLMAIPYLDFNKLGNGYYTITQRRFAYVTFQFGFLVLWITLIVMGTFLRGPNWNFFGFYETWDAHKVEALNNVDLSQHFWISLLNRPMPKAPENSDLLVKIVYVVFRELPGIALIAGYFTVLPPLLVIFPPFSALFRNMYLKMGFLRYMVMSNLLLTMALLPIKMVLRWTINLKYFIAIPEYLLNF